MQKTKRYFLLFIFIGLFTTLIFGQQINEPLIRIYEGEFLERGVKTGYVNLKGDTIIPLGKYFFCFTDTLKDFAIVLKHGGGYYAIDKNERELFEIKPFDNGPDYFSEGLLRIIKNGKIGYANAKGEIIIKPKYPCAFPFKNGRAKVALKCTTVPDHEHHRWVSKQWFYIDTKGKKIKNNKLNQLTND